MYISMVRGAVVLCCLASSALARVQTMEITGAQIGHEALRAVQPGAHVRIEKVSLPTGDVDLELDRKQVLTPDARLLVGIDGGMAELERPDIVVLSGIVAGEPDSIAYLAVSPYGTNGFVSLDGELISISTGPYAQNKNLLRSLQSARMSDVLDPENAVPVCGYSPDNDAMQPSGPMIELPPSIHRGEPGCRIAGIAVETDYEFTQRLFSGNTNASAAYLVSLMGAISEIYERDFNVRLSVPFLRVWADNTDPYVLDGPDPLDQVRNFWRDNMASVDRTIVHYFSGRQDTSYGGVAYLSVLCNTSYGYGVSAHLNGSFPYPLVDHNGGNWDVVVAAHEMGHNFGTGHTHDSYNPVIDGCGNGDCTDAYGGTIMSYCHTCSGGLTNTVLHFHPRVISTVLGYLDAVSCDLMSEGVSAIPDAVETLEETAIDIDAIGNDEAQSCDSVSLVSFDAASAQGGSVELLDGAGPGGRDAFRYTPAPGFTGDDSFSYTISGAKSGPQETAVSVSVLALRDADLRLNPVAGLGVKYYEISPIDQLPDFETLTPYASDVSTSVTYESTGGDFMNSGRADDVGVVFEGYVNVYFDGLYTFKTSSDDGSRLLIGDRLVVNNDGLHGMVTQSGSIALRAGWHKVRVEFFERGGGAGLIASVVWPTGTEVDLNGILISHESSAACSPADINADGVLNFLDISRFLEEFQAQTASGDFNDNGRYDFFDISAFLQSYQNGCP